MPKMLKYFREWKAIKTSPLAREIFNVFWIPWLETAHGAADNALNLYSSAMPNAAIKWMHFYHNMNMRTTTTCYLIKQYINGYIRLLVDLYKFFWIIISKMPYWYFLVRLSCSLWQNFTKYSTMGRNPVHSWDERKDVHEELMIRSNPFLWL